MTEAEKKEWGGYREGAGRPRVTEKKKQYNWYLSNAEHEYLKQCLKDFRAEQKKKE